MIANWCRCSLLLQRGALPQAGSLAQAPLADNSRFRAGGGSICTGDGLTVWRSGAFTSPPRTQDGGAPIAAERSGPAHNKGEYSRP